MSGAGTKTASLKTGLFGLHDTETQHVHKRWCQRLCVQGRLGTFEDLALQEKEKLYLEMRPGGETQRARQCTEPKAGFRILIAQELTLQATGPRSCEEPRYVQFLVWTPLILEFLKVEEVGKQQNNLKDCGLTYTVAL